MRRATQVSLVLMTGTAMALGLSTCGGPSAECQEARAEGRPEAEQICARSASSSRSSSTSSRRSWFGSDSARGGFGGSARGVGG